MAYRITDSVIRGEIDNRVRGLVTGRIWLAGRPNPLELCLKGNAHPDLAGCLLSFENPAEAIPDGRLLDLDPMQNGALGDLTASRKCRVMDASPDEVFGMEARGQKPPEHLANVLYLEWFSTPNGRVVIEAPDWRLQTTNPDWTPTLEDEAQRARDVADHLADFLHRFDQAIEKNRRQRSHDDHDWDEFDHEKLMRESDARTDKYTELLDKYGHGKEAEKIIAREMGWTWLVEALETEAAETHGLSDDSADFLEFPDLEEDPEPDPTREGLDWIKTEDGHIVHPLAHRARRSGQRLLDVKDQVIENASLQDFVFSVHMIAAKLAGALNSLWREENLFDPTFTVALLKRALQRVHESQKAFQPVKSNNLLDHSELAFWETELAQIREEILHLMGEYRRKKKN